MGILEQMQEEIELLKAELKKSNERISILESLQEEWISAKRAEKFCGVHNRTLAAERKRPNTLIRHKKEGNKDLYEVKSLIVYNKMKTVPKSIDPEKIRRELRNFK